MTREQLRDIYEECKHRESCYCCPYEDDIFCNNLWDYTGGIPGYESYEELERRAKKERLLDDD